MVKKKIVTRILAMVLSAALIVPQISVSAMELPVNSVASGEAVDIASENTTDGTTDNAGEEIQETESGDNVTEEAAVAEESDSSSDIAADKQEAVQEEAEQDVEAQEQVPEEAPVEEELPAEEITDDTSVKELLEEEILPGKVSVFNETIEEVEVETATVGKWDMLTESEELRKSYDEKFRVKPSSWKNINGHWDNSTIDKAFDEDFNSHWETGNGNTLNYIDVEFAQPEEISRIVYRARTDASNKGFAKRFTIYSLDTIEEAEVSRKVAEGSASITGDAITIDFSPYTFKKLRFEFTEAERGFASASILYFYKEDEVKNRVAELFTDGTYSTLREDVTLEEIQEVSKLLVRHPLEQKLHVYLRIAEALIKGVEEATSELWIYRNYPRTTEDNKGLDDYDKVYRVYPESISNNGGQYNGSSVLGNAIDNEENRWNTFWEPSRPNNNTFKNYIDFKFQEISSISSIVYGARSDASNKGFVTKYRIYANDTDNPNNFYPYAEGTAVKTGDLIEITFPEHEFKMLRFEYVEAAAADGYVSARTFQFYKKDDLKERVMDLFTDGTCSGLKPGVTPSQILALKSEISEYVFGHELMIYIDIATMLSKGIVSNSSIHDTMILSQRGNRGSESSRTDTGMTLATYDLTGYFVRPGETVQVLCNADASGIMPRIVFATVAKSPWGWYQGYDGIQLVNGLNTFTIPETQSDCYAIYFCNPALPEQQAYAPEVRLIGGTRYPVFRYNPEDSDEKVRQAEQEYLDFLDEYIRNISDNLDDQIHGDKNPNIAEMVSDKVIISTSAKGAKIGHGQESKWNAGWWRDFTDKVRFGKVVSDGIIYQGPAAAMEAYEMLFDDLQYYSGFNVDDPTHYDYRNHGQFLFRAYSHGTGAGWGQSVYSGYNTGTRDDNNNPFDYGDYVSIVTPAPVLSAGWTIYHEMGHVFDNGTIGVPESTNNLYGLYAGIKYKGNNRLDEVGENRWWNHFTSYINTGVLPTNDLLFYPGAVIWQLDAVDFSKTKMYKDTAAGDDLLSNYGMACRYARTHREELKNLDKDSKIVVSFSMACGVDLSTHFEYYGRTISNEARLMIAGLPKEPRPTWYTNDRTFTHGSFTKNEKSAKFDVTATVDATTGYVTLTAPEIGKVFSDENFQNYEAYRVRIDDNGNEIGEKEFVGISGNNKSIKNNNNTLYTIVDKNIVPGERYKYIVSAYDRTLLTNNNPATVVATIGSEATVPIEKIVMNEGDEGLSFDVGNTRKMFVSYFPTAATIDLNKINWWIEGWGRDNGHTGGSTDIITLTEDPDYPGDITHRLITAVQPGQTHLYANVGGLKTSYRIVVNGKLDVTATAEGEKYSFEFPDGDVLVAKDETVAPRFTRTTLADNTVINVKTCPDTATWVSEDENIAVVSNGRITGKAAGSTVISFKRNSDNKVLASVNVTVKEEQIPATEVKLAFEGNSDGEEEATESPASDNMTVNEERQLTYTLLPEGNTEIGTVAFRTSDSKVLVVNNKGVVRAVGQGTATITAVVQRPNGNNLVDTNIKGTIDITVDSYVPLQRLSLDKQRLDFTVDGEETAEITAFKYPENAGAKGFNWRSSNENVATVTYDQENADGTAIITAVGTGTCTVEAFLEGKYVACTVVVEKPIELTGIKFANRNNDTIETNAIIKAGDTLQLSLIPEPLNATGLGSIKWTSSNNKIATVSQGFITGVSKGNVDITGTVTQEATGVSKSVVAHVTVEEGIVQLTGIGLNRGNITLATNETFKLTINNKPVNANDIGKEKPVWTSSNEKYATVDEDGNVKALRKGATVVTATLKGFSVSCTVNVIESAVQIEKLDITEDTIILPISNDDVEVQESKQLEVKKEPVQSNEPLEWSLESGEGVVKVDNNGLVTPITEGEAVVKVKVSRIEESEEGEVADSVKIKVVKVPEDDLWIADIDNQEYTGKAIKPEIELYHGVTLLEQGKDYTVSYKNNVNVYTDTEFATKNPPTITVTCKGNYAGKLIRNFNIEAKLIEDAELSDIYLYASSTKKKDEVIYKAQKPVPTVKLNGVSLKNNKDFTITYKNGSSEEVTEVTAPGEYELVVEGKGNYAGTIDDKKVYVLDSTDTLMLSKASVGYTKSVKYSSFVNEDENLIIDKNGGIALQNLTVKSGKVIYEEETDFVVEYTNNELPGTATAIIKGIGTADPENPDKKILAGEKVVTFKITGDNINSAKLFDADGKSYKAPTVTYDIFDESVGIVPADNQLPVLKFGGEEIDETDDYIISYLNNTKPGTATIVYTGQGRFLGSVKKVNYKIAAYKYNEEEGLLSVELPMGDTYDYLKGGVKPQVEVTFYGEELIRGQDYSVGYVNNTVIGNPKKQPQVVVTMKGKYSGKINIPFEIIPQDLEAVEVAARDVDVSTSPNKYKGTIKLIDKDGKVLANNKDYKITGYYYENNTVVTQKKTGTVKRKAGDAVDKLDIIPENTVITMTISGGTGKCYVGTVEASYKVVEKGLNISKATVKVLSKIEFRNKDISLIGEDLMVTIGKPAVEIPLVDEESTEDGYYIKSYKNNTNKGNATIELQGTGRYGGTKSVTVKINAKSVNQQNVTVDTYADLISIIRGFLDSLI